MASVGNISKITLPDGNEYDIKDATAREDLDGKVNIVGDTMTGDLNLPNLKASGTVTVGNHAVLTYNETTQSLDFSFI